jgi:hypothetical protein
MPLAGLHFWVGLDFVIPSLYFILSKHHQYVGNATQIEQANITESFKAALDMTINR